METAPQASGYLHTIVPIASYCSVKALVTKPHHVCCPHRPQAPSTQSLLAVALLQWEWKGTTEEVVAGHRQYFTPAVNRSWWVGGPNIGSHTSPRASQTPHQDCKAEPGGICQVPGSCPKPHLPVSGHHQLQNHTSPHLHCAF